MGKRGSAGEDERIEGRREKTKTAKTEKRKRTEDRQSELSKEPAIAGPLSQTSGRLRHHQRFTLSWMLGIDTPSTGNAAGPRQGREPWITRWFSPAYKPPVTGGAVRGSARSLSTVHGPGLGALFLALARCFSSSSSLIPSYSCLFLSGLHLSLLSFLSCFSSFFYFLTGLSATGFFRTLVFFFYFYFTKGASWLSAPDHSLPTTTAITTTLGSFSVTWGCASRRHQARGIPPRIQQKTARKQIC